MTLVAESDLVHYRANEYGKGASLIGLSMWRLKESAVKETNVCNVRNFDSKDFGSSAYCRSCFV